MGNRRITGALLGAALAALLAVAPSGCKGRGSKGDVRSFPQCGLQLEVPAEMDAKGLVFESYPATEEHFPELRLSFAYLPETEQILREAEQLSPGDPALAVKKDRLDRRFADHYKVLLCIYLIPKEQYDAVMQVGSLLEGMERLKENAGYVYIADRQDNDTSAMGAEELALYNECLEFALAAPRRLAYTKIAAEPGSPQDGQ